MKRTVWTFVLVASALTGEFVRAQTTEAPKAPPAPAATPTPAAPVPSSARTIFTFLNTDQRFTTFVKVIQAADMQGMLAGGGTMTLFAPTNDAFTKLAPGLLDELLKPESKDRLKKIVNYHLAITRNGTKQIAGLKAIKSVNGQRVTILTTNGLSTIDGANMVQADVDCANGVVHVIDAVLMPSEKDCFETIAADPALSTFTKMLRDLGLDSLLKSKGPYTVIVPSNEALAQINKSELDKLMAPDNRDNLMKFVRRHIFAGSLASQMLGGMKTLPNMEHDWPVITNSGGLVSVSTARLVRPDIQTANGVIHIADNIVRYSPPPADKKTQSPEPIPKPVSGGGN